VPSEKTKIEKKVQPEKKKELKAECMLGVRQEQAIYNQKKMWERRGGIRQEEAGHK